MYIEIFMFKSDSLLLLTKINASIKAIKNMTKMHFKKMRNLLILYLHWYYSYKYNLSMILRILLQTNFMWYHYYIYEMWYIDI